jgi:uncharacterized membrane protein
MANASSRKRLTLAALLGAVAGVVAAMFGPWQLAVLAGWDVVSVAFIAGVWANVLHLTPEETGTHATREDDGRVATSILLLSASVASLIGIGFDLFKAGNAHTAGRVALTAIAVVTVALSWAVVHTVFTLRYAHEFYTPPVGGIDFKTDSEFPDYQDFAYIAFTVGMTFQVSDTDVQVRKIRRTVLRHALVSYVFGAVILAVMVNVIAGVLK